MDRERSSSPPAPVSTGPSVDELTVRLTTLSSQFESALELSSNLQARRTAAQSTISALERKVSRVCSSVQCSNPARTRLGTRS